MERARRVILTPDDGNDSTLTTRNQSEIASTPTAVSLSKRESKIKSPTAALNSADDEKSVQTPGDTLSRLDAEMYDVMHSNEYTSLNEKCKNYLQILRRYLFFVKSDAAYSSRENYSEETLAERNVDNHQVKPLPKTEILASLPKHLRRRGELLLRKWEKDDKLKWTNTGLVKIDGKILRDSNIIDFIVRELESKRDEDTLSALEAIDESIFNVASVSTPNVSANESELDTTIKTTNNNNNNSSDLAVQNNRPQPWTFSYSPPRTRFGGKWKKFNVKHSPVEYTRNKLGKK